MQYRFIPRVQQQITLRTWDAYRRYDVHTWARLSVWEVQAEGPDPRVLVEVMNGSQLTGRTLWVSLDDVEAPIGWKERYSIHVAPDKVNEVLAWATRGMAVRACKDLSSAGSMAYQPLDKVTGKDPGAHHWAYVGEADDIVPPEQWVDRVRVVELVHVWDAGEQGPCHYCKGTGMRTDTGWLGATWQKDGPWFGQETIPCWVCRGSGLYYHHVSSLPTKKEREAAVKRLRAAGWKVWWRKGNAETQGWEMERERVIKDWGKEVKAEA